MTKVNCVMKRLLLSMDVNPWLAKLALRVFHDWAERSRSKAISTKCK